MDQDQKTNPDTPASEPRCSKCNDTHVVQIRVAGEGHSDDLAEHEWCDCVNPRPNTPASEARKIELRENTIWLCIHEDETGLRWKPLFNLVCESGKWRAELIEQPTPPATAPSEDCKETAINFLGAPPSVPEAIWRLEASKCEPDSAALTITPATSNVHKALWILKHLPHPAAPEQPDPPVEWANEWCHTVEADKPEASTGSEPAQSSSTVRPKVYVNFRSGGLFVVLIERYNVGWNCLELEELFSSPKRGEADSFVENWHG